MSLGLIALKMSILLLGLYLISGYLVHFERQVMGHLGLRGKRKWAGVWPLVDMARALRKESALPVTAQPVLYYGGPLVALAGMFAAVALIPVGAGFSVGGEVIWLWVANPALSLPVALMLDGLAVLGTLLGARGFGIVYVWEASREVVRRFLIYSLPALLSLVGVVMLSGSLNLVEIVRAQHTTLPYAVYQPLGMLLLAISLLSAGRRLPYRLPECPNAILGDFHLQHGGGALAQYHLVEILHLVFSSALIATVYLAGWYGPWRSGPHWLILKTVAVSMALLWLREKWLARRIEGERRWLVLTLLAAFNTLLTVAILAWSH